MHRGNRRSSRLIASPWLYNWPKKPPVYVDLVSAERTTEDMNRSRRTVVRGVMEVDDLDVRSEWGKVNQDTNVCVSESGEEFATPCEFLSSKGTASARLLLTGGSILVRNMDLDTLSSIHGANTNVCKSTVRRRGETSRLRTIANEKHSGAVGGHVGGSGKKNIDSSGPVVLEEFNHERLSTVRSSKRKRAQEIVSRLHSARRQRLSKVSTNNEGINMSAKRAHKQRNPTKRGRNMKVSMKGKSIQKKPGIVRKTRKAFSTS